MRLRAVVLLLTRFGRVRLTRCHRSAYSQTCGFLGFAAQVSEYRDLWHPAQWRVFAHGYFVLLLVLVAGVAQGEPSAAWITRAEKLQRDTPTAWRALGLVEIQRSAGTIIDPARAAADLPKTGAAREAALESIAWRMMPVATPQRKTFDSIVDSLAQLQPKNPWAAVFRLYSASVADDRAALIAAAKTLTDAPASFPASAAEKAHFELLKELGVDDNQAGLEVISHRAFAPLHGLLDLDRALSRQVDFLEGTSRANDAKLLRDCRDRLRQAWLDASSRLVERLFALHALGREQDCDALLFAARDLPYLTDAAEMTRTLARLDQTQAWSMIISPLLESEIRLIASPPKLPGSAPAAASQLTIEAKNKSVQNSISTYEGAVRARAGNLDIACDKLAVIGDAPATAKLLSGAGNITIRGAAGFELIQCDNFSFNLDTGAFSLGGNVRLKRGEQTIKYRACTLSRTGEVRDSVSLLDDFDAAPDARARLALLPQLTACYADAELPPGAQYLLGLNLLRPHLLWRQAPPSPGHELPIDPWLREEAIQQIQSAQVEGPKPSRVETILQQELPGRLSCTVKDPNHAEVARAKQLLALIINGSHAQAAQRWLAEIR